MAPEPNHNANAEQPSLKVPSKDPKNKKEEKKEEDLSEEDLALKQQLRLYVESVQDSEPGVQKLALESMRTGVDPVILAKYVEGFLKKDKPTKELEKLCAANLHEFLGHETNSFVTKLFKDLESGSILNCIASREISKQIKLYPASVTADTSEIEVLSQKEETFPSTSQANDLEKNDITDDEDDDRNHEDDNRNHKHRRRETQSQSSDRDDQDLFTHKPSRKRGRPFENGQNFLDLANHDRETTFKFEKRQPGLALLSRAPYDFAPRARFNTAYRNDSGYHFDSSTSFGRSSMGRGRGRSTGWNMHDSRFNSVETLDFASSLTPHGSEATSIFAGRGLANVPTTSNTTWNTFGMIHRMPNGGLDPLHPLQGPLPRPINPSINIGLLRARCRDFEERGFCLRGDMCPMEHGVNRIVIEDVQSLSQFNLPVSIPNAPILGIPSGPGLVTSSSLPTTLLSGNKASDIKAGKYEQNIKCFGTNGVISDSAAENEADLYDPDKPLWNNEQLEAPGVIGALSPPKADDVDTAWDTDSSERHTFRFSGNKGNNRMEGNAVVSSFPQSTSSVWGRIGGSSKLDADAKLDCDLVSTSYSSTGKKLFEVEESLNAQGTSHQGKQTTGELQAKVGNNNLATHKSHLSAAHGNEKGSEKAYSTLFVNRIPKKNNRKNLLLSHFQKFGDVIDIHIPPNSEKAFVQFSRREDAESALRAPDAVIGNRFIRLWWANRDNITHEGEGYPKFPSTTFHRGVTATVMTTQSSGDRGKENLQSSKTSSISEMPFSDPTPSKQVATESTTDASLQKRLELEQLKEELRKKQEMLDRKRNDFKRQLDKLEKQGVTVKGEIPGKVTQQPRAAVVPMVTNDVAPTKVSTHSSQVHLQERCRSVGNAASSNVKTLPDMQQQSPKGFKQMSYSPLATGANWFKLDNRPTAFKILPPLPTNLANVSLLKEHFAAFGDLSAVEMDDMDGHTDTAEDCCAKIIFLTRRSAERAFFNGKCLEGHIFQFVWLPNSSSSRQPTSRETCGTLVKKESDIDHVTSERSKSCSSSLSTEKQCEGRLLPISSVESVKTGVEESKSCQHERTRKQESESSSGRPSDEETTIGGLENTDGHSKAHHHHDDSLAQS